MRRNRFLFWGVIILVALGLGVSEYLLTRSLALASGAPGQDWCAAVFGGGCDRALRDPSAQVGGIPLAGWGVVYFGSVLLLLVLGWALDPFRNAAGLSAFALGCVAAAGSAWLAGRMILGSAPLCPMCLVVHGVNWLLLPGFWVLARGLVRSPRPAGRDAEAPVHVHRRGRIRTAVGFGMTAAVACVLYLWVAGAWRASGLVDPARLLNEFVAARQVDIPLDSDDALFGETNAPVRLVVFSDFNCPGCREFARTLPALHEFFRGRLAIYFKHYPLSCDCHPKLRLDLHPGSCQAAWAAEAARRQDRFRAFHDLLVAAPGATSDALLRAAARRVGLDLDRFDEDRENPAVRRKVAADLDLGTRLGVDGTPSIFLDGRRVRDLRPAALMFLVATRVEAAAP